MRPTTLLLPKSSLIIRPRDVAVQYTTTPAKEQTPLQQFMQQVRDEARNWRLTLAPWSSEDYKHAKWMLDNYSREELNKLLHLYFSQHYDAVRHKEGLPILRHFRTVIPHIITNLEAH